MGLTKLACCCCASNCSVGFTKVTEDFGTSTLNEGRTCENNDCILRALVFDLQHMSGQKARQSTEHMGGHMSETDSSFPAFIGFTAKAADVNV